MSIAGKKNTHYVKKDLQDQKVPAVIFKNLRFAHQASAGETIINLLSLNTPSSGMPASFTQPSTTDLSAVNLSIAKSNFRLVSSLKGYLEFDSYEITGPKQITLGFSAEEDETFVGVIENTPKTGLQVIDNDPIVVTTVLPAGSTEINVGKPFDLNKYSTTNQGAVLVIVEGQILKRNTGNTQSASGDKDYYEFDNGSTSSSIVRLNEPSTVDREVVVVSLGLNAAAPTDSLLAQMQNVAGQLDQIIPALAAVTGLPESTFQAAPNDVDLLNFGLRMTALESNLAEGGDPANGPVLATSTTVGAVKKNRFGTKTLESLTPAAMNGLALFSIEAGKVYEIYVQLNVFNVSSSLPANFVVQENGNDLARGGAGSNTDIDDRFCVSVRKKFTATATGTITLNSASDFQTTITDPEASFAQLTVLENEVEDNSFVL